MVRWNGMSRKQRNLRNRRKAGKEKTGDQRAKERRARDASGAERVVIKEREVEPAGAAETAMASTSGVQAGSSANHDGNEAEEVAPTSRWSPIGAPREKREEGRGRRARDEGPREKRGRKRA